jgi:hypothetical protein
MEISDNALNVLKNFSTINPSLVVKEGHQLKTISAARNIVSIATLKEDFPRDFGIYDLNEFITVLRLVDEPELKFQDDYVVIGDAKGQTKVKYFYAEQSLIKTVDKDMIMPPTEVNFTLDNDTLSKIRSAASAMGYDDLVITPEGEGQIKMTVTDIADDTSNAFSVIVQAEYESGMDFRLIYNINNIKVVPEDFEVGISSKMVSNWTSAESEIEYFIALEKKHSTYGE